MIIVCETVRASIAVAARCLQYQLYPNAGFCCHLLAPDHQQIVIIISPTIRRETLAHLHAAILGIPDIVIQIEANTL